ncbi:hypothetical protein C8N41_10113 [Winogradskyella sediminis]|nr:hypothetical protein C8N41_10113 [Winogradskyella sediminis]
MKANIYLNAEKYEERRLEIGTSTKVEFCNYLVNRDFASFLDCTFNFL